MIVTQCIDRGVVSELILLANLREEGVRGVVLPLAYRLIGPLFILVPFMFWFFVVAVETRVPVRDELVGYAALIALGLFTTWQYGRKAVVSPFKLTFSGLPFSTTVPWVDVARIELGSSWLILRTTDGRVRKLSTSSKNAEWLVDQAQRRGFLYTS